jgi:uncharacterized protein (TIGR02117 family)
MKAFLLKIGKIGFRFGLFLLALPILYLIAAFILSAITVNSTEENPQASTTIFIATNGVHLDIIVPKSYLREDFLQGMVHYPKEKFLAFGWGDENFYLNTPTWNDLTFSNAFSALFLKSTTLMHVTRYRQLQPRWQKVKINEASLAILLQFIDDTFQQNEQSKILLKGKGYSYADNFYKAQGTYTCLNTCNTWVNSAFKASGLKACLWTPFDFALIDKYR